MDEQQVFEEIKSVINVISIFQSRESALRKELKFFEERQKDGFEGAWERTLFFGAFKRLEHEIMFLCIEVYSLHQGIAEERSLYSKVIKQHGRLLKKVDKTPKNEEEYQWLGIISSDGMPKNFTAEEKNALMQYLKEEEYRSREKLRDDLGITSHNHDEIDERFNQVLDESTLSSLKEYRKRFAHRFDRLEKLELELELTNCDAIEQMLDVLSTVLNKYEFWLKNIILYTKSILHEGIVNFEYDSLSRLELAESVIRSSDLQEIEHAVSRLSAEELAAFRVWFAEFDAEIWDRQIEEDVAAGRLDGLAKRALQHLREGRCTDL